MLDRLLERMRYVPGTFDDDSVYEQLAKQAAEFDEEAGIPFNRVFYLSTAPAFFPVIVHKLGDHDLDRHEGSEVRVVIEKPIGTNLAEAQELNREVLKVLDEPQVFRIDHYLGKETVQNMLAFRFANGMFEPVWSRNFIDYVQITAAEDIGIGTRAGYYDQSGALRDLVQNHMLQLLTLLCMEPPVTFSAGDVRDEKVKVLHAIHTPDPDRVPSMPSGPSTRPAWLRASPCPATCRRRGCPTSPPPRATPPSGSRSTTGVGPACRSTSAPASGWRGRSQRSR